MSIMSIRIDDQKRKLLKVLASAEGRTMTEVVGTLLDEYIARRKALLGQYGQDREAQALMKVSEAAFAEWNNAEDEIYDRM